MAEPDPVVTPDTPARTCAFKLADDSKCPSIKVFARGFCEKHYRTLRRRGAFGPDSPAPTKKLTPAALIMENVATVKRARRALLKEAPTFVTHLLAASKTASEKGDATPAQWALLHTRTVSAPANAASNAPGVVVNVGVKVDPS